VFLACEGDEWLSDFVIEDGQVTAASSMLRIDHVALSLPFGVFDEAVLFFRSVFGLEPEESLELADPYGLIRSRAMADPGENVRVALNMPQVGGSASGHVAGVEHVAFTCSDVFATAEALRSNGMRLLPISDNYYDDLVARWDLPAELVVTMREFGVLYDQNDDGEFFHLYTEMAGPRLFFEIVQRVDRYAGYGAANAPTRMAAQRSSRPRDRKTA
jgi:4-hydroxyphenylpyruvate dioxygenase